MKVCGLDIVSTSRTQPVKDSIKSGKHAERFSQKYLAKAASPSATLD